MKKRWSNRAKAIRRLMQCAEIDGRTERASELKKMLMDELSK